MTVPWAAELKALRASPKDGLFAGSKNGTSTVTPYALNPLTAPRRSHSGAGCVDRGL
jgi:hypothetical protein